MILYLGGFVYGVEMSWLFSSCRSLRTSAQYPIMMDMDCDENLSRLDENTYVGVVLIPTFVVESLAAGAKQLDNTARVLDTEHRCTMIQDL
jgi:hypothetical protein